MNKKLLPVTITVILLCTVFFCFSASAATTVASGTCGAQGDNMIWALYDDGALIISGTGEMWDWSDFARWYSYQSSIKKVVINEGVTSIAKSAFKNCTSLESIKIPDSVTTIGDWAFSNCATLTSIEIPDSVTTIGDYAFSNCNSLKNIEIPENVTTIGNYMFWNCSSLESIKIAEGVTSIGYSAFDSCESLASIEIPDGVTSIGNCAFYYCISLTSIEIPDGVTSIGSYTFQKCTSLKNIEIPDSVTSIGDGAFDRCESLTSIEIPDSVTTIGDYTFQYCETLTCIEIPESVTSISEFAFFGCKSLANIEIPEGVTSIDKSAFSNCISLTKAIIPTSVTIIGKAVFLSCPNLTIYGYTDTFAETYAKDNSIPFVFLDGHECAFGDWVTIKEPTGTKEGKNQRECSFCGHREYEAEPPCPEILLTIGNAEIVANGEAKALDVPAQIVDSRTMVPLRAIFEALGASVEWDDATKTVTSVKDDSIVKLTIGNPSINVNGVDKALDVPAQIVESRTLVPVRAVAESFGCEVLWDDTTKTVTIR